MRKVLSKGLMAFAVSSILVTATSCGGKQEETTTIRSVILTTPQSRAEGFSRVFPALIKESNETSLGFKTPGEIARVYVKEGDYVRKGQLLASLDATDYRLAVNALQVQYDQVKKEVARATELFQKKGMSANEYEKAQAGLAQLETQLQANKNKLSYTQLYAPTNGYIQSVNFSKAEMVDAGTAVFTILDDTGMKVEFDVPVSESGIVRKPGADYRLIVNEDSEIPLRFVSMTPKADGNQLYTVKLTFESAPPKYITPGINATVVMESTMAEQNSNEGFNLPLRSVLNHEGKACVWVMKPDSTVAKRTVTFGGLDKNGEAIVTSGLRGDEKVVCAGVNSLHEGEKVKVVEKTSETNVGGMM